MVESEPSWPVFMAWSMSSASEPRTSPTMMRSGRMRRALRTRSRIVTSPLLSMLGGRASNRITCCWRSWSSTASSMVTMRSLAGTKDDRTLSSVVLPVPVPPETSTLRPPSTAPLSTVAIDSVRVLSAIRSATWKGSWENLRMVRIGPSNDSGGTMALTRDPSARRASTMGEDSSMRRPTWPTMRSMTRRRWSSERKRVPDGMITPARST